MAYFPMFIELQAAPVLVVGGGNVALRKVKKLLPYGADITVIAPKMEKELEENSKSTEFTVNLRRRIFYHVRQW